MILSPSEHLLERATAGLPDLLSDLESIIACETPSADLDAVAAGAALVDRIVTARLGTPGERIVVDGRTHLRWRFGSETATPRVLLLCHQDTVWPIGTLARLPFDITDDVLTGPGGFDMKTGLAMAVHALLLLDAAGTGRAVTLLVTGDEEIGSPTSRALIEREAVRCTATFVLEASGQDGGLKTGRKGVSMFRVDVTGRAAHAGLEPEKGINAGVELARQVLAIDSLGDAVAGTSVVPTVSAAGTTGNTVPALASVQVDSRAWTADEQRRVETAMLALSPHEDGAWVEVTGGINRPPMETDAAQPLFRLACAVADELGIAAESGPLQQVSVGGGSDGNFTAGVGCPTLDGLGAVGGGAHADTEHVVVAQIPRRTALLAGLIRAVLDGAPVR